MLMLDAGEEQDENIYNILSAGIIKKNLIKIYN
jgi:hypothetical protein